MCRFVCLLLACLAPPLPAHDPGLSSVHVVRHDDTLVVMAAFANADFAAVEGVDRNHDGQIDAAELAFAAMALPGRLAADFVLHLPDGSLRATALTAALADNLDVELRITFAAANDVGHLDLVFLQRLSRSHRCYAAALDGAGTILNDALLTVRESRFALPSNWHADAGTGGFGQGARFFVLGIEHILIGFDHLAFLLALLVAGGGLRRAIATITAFTVAHSITLAAAALGVLRLPSLSVEIAIAGSIVWVALENLLRRGRPAVHRWPVAFVFGLVHGLGFANVLADLQVGGADILTPLLTFNLGVEVGQTAFAAVAVPLIALAARRPGGRWLPTIVSIGIGLAGLFWLWERTSS